MTSVTSIQPRKILFLIRSLNIGGAERQVVSLARSISTLGTEVHVAVKAGGGPLEHDLAEIPGARLHHIIGSGPVGLFRHLLRLRHLIAVEKYDAVYGFMPVPNLSLLVARTFRSRPLIAWGIRSSHVDPSQYGGRVKWTMKVEKWLSKFADRIITNSQAALEEYRLKGYPCAKLSHVPNAINTDRFQPEASARKILSVELGIPIDVPLIGMFARIHPMKDHMTFLGAVEQFLKISPGAHFICAGEDPIGYSHYANRIRQNAVELGVEKNISWLGPRTDPEILMAACDITTLTSNSGEGFPNSVAESLACGTPCVVTDVGDGAAIVGDSSKVVPRGDQNAMSMAWAAALSDVQANEATVSRAARQSIVDRYSPEQIALTTLTLLSE